MGGGFRSFGGWLAGVHPQRIRAVQYRGRRPGRRNGRRRTPVHAARSSATGSRISHSRKNASGENSQRRNAWSVATRQACVSARPGGSAARRRRQARSRTGTANQISTAAITNMMPMKLGSSRPSSAKTMQSQRLSVRVSPAWYTAS